MNEKPLKIAVVGAGAVGGYYGGMLAFAGEDVHFLFRRDYEHVSREGLTLRLAEGERKLVPVNAYDNTEAIGPCDLVIVALKTTSNAALPALLRPLVGEHTLLLTLQNGLGNEELLAADFEAGRVLGGLCFICLNRIAPGVVENFFPGYLVLGEFSGPARERTEAIADRFRAAGIDCSVSPSLAEARWRKLVWNIPFNGLAIAAGGIDTGRILGDDGLTALAEALMRETIAIAAAKGIEIEGSFIASRFELTRPMGAYQPSSLVDFLAGRAVEVESIWGEPLRQGAEAGVESPRLDTLYRLLKVLTPVR